MTFQRAFNSLALTGFVSASLFATCQVNGQESAVKQVTEPVFRVSRLVQPNEDEKPVEVARNTKPVPSSSVPATLPAASAAAVAATPASAATSPHPLDNAIELAHAGLDAMKNNILDYTAILMKRECVGGTVGEPEFMRIKIRNPRTTSAGEVPFSVYMKFLKPKNKAGREVIWVEGRNNNKLMAHESGLLGVVTVHLDPDGSMAMNGNRHPIYEAGLENLVLKLIDKAERDRAAGLCKVEYRDGAKINGRECTMIEVIHDQMKDPYEFHKAQVFIDTELQIPVRYSAWNWPTSPGAEPQLIEEYTYIKVETNIGLTDLDFDPKNQEYDFPGR